MVISTYSNNTIYALANLTVRQGPKRKQTKINKKQKQIIKFKRVMKKYFFLAAVAALTLASCAKVETYKVSEDTAISFGVYTGRSLTQADGANYASAGTLVNNAQFGVYGWYTDMVLLSMAPMELSSWIGTP